MVRKYFEQVSSKMLRFRIGSEVVLLRQPTEIRFGDGTNLLGIVLMTNPGSFEFKRAAGWKDFKTGQPSTSDSFQALDFPDPTMQNVIEVVRTGYERAGLGYPSGVLRVHNISNVREPKHENVESYHSRVKRAFKENGFDIRLLEDPITNVRTAFLRACHESPFVMMGFVDKVFQKQVCNLMSWSMEKLPQIIAAVDDKGRFSHPRRWRTELNLKERATQSLVTFLTTQTESIRLSD